MNKNETIDVVIPTYNSTKELERAVLSVLRQTNFAVNNIIIVDDGSLKSVLQEVRQLFSGEKRVTIVEHVHTGHPGLIRKVGVESSTSDWIAFLDSDDWWEPNKLELQMNFARVNNFEAVVSNARRWSSETESDVYFNKAIEKQIDLEMLIKDNLVINSSLLIKRSVLLSIGGYAVSQNVRRAEDYATILRVAYHKHVGFINRNLVNYKDFGESYKTTESVNVRIFAWIDFLNWLAVNSFSLGLSLKIRLFLRIWKEYIGSLP